MEFQYGEESLRILIIRPGETLYDREGHIQGNLNVRLTDNGKFEAEMLADELKNEDVLQLYYAPTRSALETAQIISHILEIPMKSLDGLKNQDQGIWQGMRISDLKRSQPKVFRRLVTRPDSISPPGGEDFAEVKERVGNVIRWLLGHHHYGTIGLVICEPLASFVRCQLKSEEARNLWNYIGLHGLWEPVEIQNQELILR